jgi:hypothetical protein
LYRLGGNASRPIPYKIRQGKRCEHTKAVGLSFYLSDTSEAKTIAKTLQVVSCYNQLDALVVYGRTFLQSNNHKQRITHYNLPFFDPF